MSYSKSVLTAFISFVVFLSASASYAAPTVNVNGRIQVDAALYDEDVTELGSGTEFRRLRLAGSGDLAEGWKYKAELDFADNSLDIKDAFVAYASGAGTVKIGQFKMPSSLEELTSSRHITFMERALPNVFATGRRIGVGLDRNDGPMNFAAAIYGQNADNDDNQDEGLGLGARFTYAPVMETDQVVHIGASAAYEELSTTDSDSVRVRQRPESHITTRLVTTTLDGVEDSTKFGLEGAGVFGPFSVQAEYMMQSFSSSMGDVDLSGYYAYASWFPGQGMRPYKKGKFDRVKVENAWEFAVRYSSLDLNDGQASGGEEDNVTFAVNYYVNPNLRFMFNYILADIEGGINGDEDPNIAQFRASLDF